MNLRIISISAIAVVYLLFEDFFVLHIAAFFRTPLAFLAVGLAVFMPDKPDPAAVRTGHIGIAQFFTPCHYA
jgi:hypothetical protein